MADTVRSLTELLDILFASNQAPRSITEQDVRDAIVSISLETADFSTLPRSGVDLPVGRCWIDVNTALRVVTSYQPSVILVLDGGGTLFANPQKLGNVLTPASATTAGSGSFRADATAVSVIAKATFSGGGAATITAATVIRLAASVLTGGASTVAIPSPLAGGSFSSAFSSAFRIGGSISTQQSANATLSPTGRIIATPQRATVTGFDAANKSIYITLSGTATFSADFSSAFAAGGINTLATKTGFDGWYGGAKTTVFRSSGKWYWEFVIGAKVGDTGVGLANPSWPVDNGDPSFGSYLGLPGAGTSVGLYGRPGGPGYANDGGASLIDPMPNVAAGGNVGFALDCDNWKWWARQDGGAWNAGQPGAQDPASNQGGIPIGASYRVGGIGPAITLQGLNDAVTGRFSSWSFIPPAGFSAI